MKTVVTAAGRERCCDYARVAVYAITILAVFLIAWALVRAMKSYAPTPAVNANRAQERAAARADLAQKAQADLNSEAYAVIVPHNQTRQMPIKRAMEITIQEAKNPAAWRSNFLARVEKATAPAPKAPEKPSEFE